MPPRGSKAKGKVQVEQIGSVGKAQALRLRKTLNEGARLDDDTLLRLLGADKPCEGLYSKTCKAIDRALGS